VLIILSVSAKKAAAISISRAIGMGVAALDDPRMMTQNIL
jgi:hypothetical protein